MVRWNPGTIDSALNSNSERVVHSGQIASRKSGQRPQSQSIWTIDGILDGSVANAETEERLIFKVANPIEKPDTARRAIDFVVD